MKFSQRIGIVQVRSSLQIEYMDGELRNKLWNIIDLLVFSIKSGSMSNEDNNKTAALYRGLWHNFFKEPTDTLSNHISQNILHIRNWYFKAAWFAVYDLIEYMGGVVDDQPTFSIIINNVLESEMSGYRLVKGNIIQLTDKREIDAIEKAIIMASKNKYSPAAEHLVRATELCFDRKSPDFRNSIKEAISSVESTAKIIAGGKSGDTLGDALKHLKKNEDLHPALEKAFMTLYGYTSDAHGIRHAMMESSMCDFEDAKFMLIACSAFVHFLISKSSK